MGSKALDASREGNGRATAARRKLSPGPGLAAQQVAAHQLARIQDATTQLVAERGYRALKIRDIVRRAEVSTRAFYEHFGSKEDCFLQIHDLITRRSTRRIIAAQAGERDWRKRPRLVFDRFVRELEGDPARARIALIEAYTAGKAPSEQAWSVERTFEEMLAEAFARPPRGVVVPPMIVEGMVAGILSVSRDRLRAGRVEDLSGSGDELIAWALCYPHRVASDLAELDQQSVWRDTTLQAFANASANRDASSSDRALILDAVAELAAVNGYAGITAPRIRASAGVSKRKFEAHFEGVEDCYLAALDQRARKALAQAARAQAAAGSWAGGVYRAIAALCEHVAVDSFLVRVCLDDDFPPSPDGARLRQRLLAAAVELFSDNAPQASRPTPLTAMASTGAIWSLFHHHIIRDRALHHQIAATLSYLALAPIVGAPAAVAAIQSEQGA